MGRGDPKRFDEVRYIATLFDHTDEEQIRTLNAFLVGWRGGLEAERVSESLTILRLYPGVLGVRV